MAYDGIHPDFIKYKHIRAPLIPFLLPAINFFLTQVFYHAPVAKGLTRTRHTIPGYQDAPLKLTALSPAGQQAPLPALVYFHGGAFALQAAPYHLRLAADYALQTPCQVILVDYRLLPKAVFPTGLEDCFAAYQWIVEHAASLGIDKDRIAVGGDSAGGALASGLCLLARDRALPLPCFQMLIYPVTDNRQAMPSMKEFTGTPLWNSRLNAKMWRLYLKGCPPALKGYASPAEAAALTGLPPAYVEVAEYDCLRDEGIAFAEALQEGGVSAALHPVPGAVHGFEIAKNNALVQTSLARRIAALRAAFAR